MRAREERQGGGACSSKRVPMLAYWLGIHGLCSYSYMLERIEYRGLNLLQDIVFVYCVVGIICVCALVIIYRSTPPDRRIVSLFPLLLFLSLIHGDPIDRRRCQSLLHPFPEPQGPGRSISEYQHTPLRRSH